MFTFEMYLFIYLCIYAFCIHYGKYIFYLKHLSAHISFAHPSIHPCTNLPNHPSIHPIHRHWEDFNYDNAPTFFSLKANNTRCFCSVSILTSRLPSTLFFPSVCWPASWRTIQANFAKHLMAAVCRWLSGEYWINLQMEGLVFSFDGVNNYSVSTH